MGRLKDSLEGASVNSSSLLARRLIQVDPKYCAIVDTLRNMMIGNHSYNRALLLDAVLLADELEADRKMQDMLDAAYATFNT